MKTFTIFLTVLIALTITANAQIPNNGFENWTTFGNYENPDGWGTPNGECGGTFYPVTKSTDTYPVSVGNFSIRLENNISLLANTCGVGASATGQYPNLKFPITGHPTSLTGYYKFLPQNNDTMTIFIRLYDVDTQVSSGLFQTTISASTWTPFNISFSGYITADSASVMLAAYSVISGAYPQCIPYGNSVLYVDNINFDNLITSVSEQSVKNNLFNLYPNPSFDFVRLNIDYSHNTDLTLNIYNAVGELISSKKLKQNQQQINIDDLNNGIYMVEIKSKKCSEKQKLIIQR